MDFQDLKNKSISELKELLATSRASLHQERVRAHSKQLKQVHKLPLLRKDVARLTMLITNATKAVAVAK